MQKNILIFFIGVLFCLQIFNGCGFKDDSIAVSPNEVANTVTPPSPNDVTSTNEVKEILPFEIFINDVQFNFTKNKNGEYDGVIHVADIKSISINTNDELFLKYQILYKLKNSEEETVKILDEEVLQNQKVKISLKLPDQNEIKNIQLMKINFERVYKDTENIKFTITLEDKNND